MTAQNKPDPDSRPAVFDARTATKEDADAALRAIVRDAERRRYTDRVERETGALIARYATKAA